MGCDVSRGLEDEKRDEEDSKLDPWPVAYLQEERPQWLWWNLARKVNKVLKEWRDRQLSEPGRVEEPFEFEGLKFHTTITCLSREPDQPTLKAWAPVLIRALSTWLGSPTPANDNFELGYKRILGSLSDLYARQKDRGSLEAQALKKLQAVAKKLDIAEAEELNAWHAKQSGESWKLLTSIKNQDCVANQLECPKIKELAQKRDFCTESWGYRVKYPLLSYDGIYAFRLLGAELGKTDLAAQVEKVLNEYPKIPVLSIKPGPEKTRERCVAKRDGYKKESVEEGGERWLNLEKHAKGALTGKHKDYKFFASILDYSRIALTFSNSKSIVEAVTRISEKFEVVGLKNGMRPDFKPPPSGYRDVKLLIRFPLEREITVKDPKNKKYLPFPKGTKFICEVQLLHERYLQNKLTTSTRYKVRRATSWKELVRDFSKYI